MTLTLHLSWILFFQPTLRNLLSGMALSNHVIASCKGLLLCYVMILSVRSRIEKLYSYSNLKSLMTVPLLMRNCTVHRWPALAAFMRGVRPASDSCSYKHSHN